MRQGWFDQSGCFITGAESTENHNPDVDDDELTEEQIEDAVYCFEHVKFTLSGRCGVSGLPIPSLMFLCQLYITGFDNLGSQRRTRRELLGELLKHVRSS